MVYMRDLTDISIFSGNRHNSDFYMDENETVRVLIPNNGVCCIKVIDHT